MRRVVPPLAVLLLVVGFRHGLAAAPKKASGAPACGPVPKPMDVFTTEATECWLGTAVPPSALSYAPLTAQQQQGLPKATASSWEELQKLLEDAEEPLDVSLSGSLTAAVPLVVRGRAAALRIAGPASIQCSGAGSTAFVIIRSSGLVLQDLSISGCSGGAITINATAPTAAAGAAAAAAATTGKAPPGPDVLLRSVSITNCSTDGSGGGLAVYSSRVVLHSCELSGNEAGGCGGGVYAEGSSLLLLDTNFTGNLGNNTAGDDTCRGGALHAERSWLGALRSSWSSNLGVNGSAVLLVAPVGVSQLQDCIFDSNRPRPGVSQEFYSSSGAVALLGSDGFEQLQLRRGSQRCVVPEEGLVVARCSFRNNTAALTGGEGGTLGTQQAFLAVINSSMVGAPPASQQQPADTAAGDSSSSGFGSGREAYRSIVMSAYTGGCVSLEASSGLISGSSFSHCNTRFVGGAIASLGSHFTVRDSHIQYSYADMGGGLRATNGALLLHNSSVVRCRGLSTAAGIYLESNAGLSVHIEQASVQHNSLTGRGGGLLAELVEDNVHLHVSIHNSTFSHNTGTYGGGMAMYSATRADLRNNLIAHNTALKYGGGMECAKYYGEGHVFTAFNNTWANNSALVRGGGAITHPCNITLHSDRFLGNRAEQEGGGFMVYGGTAVLLQRVRVSCNTAQNGGGLMVKLSDSSDDSKLDLRCSEVTANGGVPEPGALQGCLDVLQAADAAAAAAGPGEKPPAVAATAPGRPGVLLAAIAAAAGGNGGGVSGPAAAAGQLVLGSATAAAAEKGGGLYIAADQTAVVSGSSISGNRASSSGAGIYLDRKAVLQLRAAASSAADAPGLGAGAGAAAGGVLGSSVSYNNCTGGSGGGAFLDEGSHVDTADTTWSNNQGMFGGAVFAMGNETSLTLARVAMTNNSAAAGGAVATLGGSGVSCSEGCRFAYNRAKVGAALMLHGGTTSLTGSSLIANTAAVSTGTGGAAAGASAAAATGATTAAETIQYMLGEVQVSAGGGAYVWHGSLTLTGCNVTDNVAWGATGRGGGVFVDESQLQLVNSSLRGNWASAAGGAVLLGPTGVRQLVEVVGGSFTGNAAGHFGGAAAGGLLLPGDAAAATAHARASGGAAASSSYKWALRFSNTAFRNNTAGRQGGALACSLCDTLAIRGSKLTHNFAAQTGGGVSCVGCARFSMERVAFEHNAAASGGGACVLAAGEGSQCSSSDFVGNAAGAEAAAAAHARLQRHAAAAAIVAGAIGSTIHGVPGTEEAGLPSAQQALPACGVVGSGGGLCLGLWRTGFGLLGSSRFLNNSALFGAGLFIEACAEGPYICPMALNPSDTEFRHNTLLLPQDGGSGFAGAYGPGALARRHLLQGTGPVAADMAALQEAGQQLPQQDGGAGSNASVAAATSGDSLGSGADLYVTNATVLVSLHKPGKPSGAATGAKQGAQPAPAAMAAAGAAGRAASAGAQPVASAAGGRHLRASKQQQQHQQQQQPATGNNTSNGEPGLAVAQQLAAEVQPQKQRSGAAAGKPAVGSQAAVAAAGAGGLSVADAIAARVATGPAKLGQIVVTGMPFASAGAASSAASPEGTQQGAPHDGQGGRGGSRVNVSETGEPNNVVEGSVSETGQLQSVQLPVLDQLGGQVANDVAEQLSVQAVADFGNCTACQLGGISKVLPVNGTARFDQLQLLARPGSNQSITFKLLSATEGVELPGGRQVVRVRLPSCQWGQATTAVGCYNCTSPLFSFSYSSNKCSICPDNAAYCSGTSLLPDSGYWNSGPLSTRMHKCPRRNACLRSTEALEVMQCLQQQQLILRNPEYQTDSDNLGDLIRGTSRGVATPWDMLRRKCTPILLQLAAAAASGSNTDSFNPIAAGAVVGRRRRRRQLLQLGTNSTDQSSSNTSANVTLEDMRSLLLDPYLNSTEVVAEHYDGFMCARGYSSRLCTQCVFPGDGADGAYGMFYTGCGKCPPRHTAIVTYALSRVFDIALVALLICTTLVEMKQRRKEVQNARRAAFAKLGSAGTAPAGQQAPHQQQALPHHAQQPGSCASPQPSQQAGKALTGGGAPSPGPGAAQASAANSDPAAHAMWLSGAAGGVADDDDAPLPPVTAAKDQLAHQQQQQSSSSGAHGQAAAGTSASSSGHQEIMGLQNDQAGQQQQQPQSASSLTPWDTKQLHTPRSMSDVASATPQALPSPSVSAVGAFGAGVGISPACSAHAVAAGASVGTAGAAATGTSAAGGAGSAGGAAVGSKERKSKRPLKRGPLFARELPPSKAMSGYGSRHVVINYSPASLTVGELFEVFKDFLQVLSILQAVLLGWQTAAAAAMSSISVTPMSTKAWISLDCILPRTEEVANNQVFYGISVQLLLPIMYLLLMTAVFMLYAVWLSVRSQQALFRSVLAVRLKAPIISSMLCMLSYFYPSLAYTILGVFSCRYLDPSGGVTSIPGEVLTARGWFWTEDLNRECFVDPSHRTWALGLGIPGTLALLAYPLLQGIILGRKARHGQLTPTSDFFGNYGHLVEDFRPRLFYWGSIVELRKLVLVAVVLGLASTGVISQLVGCSLVLLGFCAATMGLLPYPYRVLNRLHLGSAAVLLAVVWLNLFVAVGEEGGMLSGGISGSHSLALQLLSVALVVVMVATMLGMCGVMFYRKAKEVLDVDGDGRISWNDLQALVAKKRAQGGLAGLVAKLMCCCGSAQPQPWKKPPRQRRRKRGTTKAVGPKGPAAKGITPAESVASTGLTSTFSNVIVGNGGMMVIGGPGRVDGANASGNKS